MESSICPLCQGTGRLVSGDSPTAREDNNEDNKCVVEQLSVWLSDPLTKQEYVLQHIKTPEEERKFGGYAVDDVLFDEMTLQIIEHYVQNNVSPNSPQFGQMLITHWRKTLEILCKSGFTLTKGKSLIQSS